jgi:hypothetical protein
VDGELVIKWALVSLFGRGSAAVGLNSSGEFSRRRGEKKFPVLPDEFPDTPELIPCSESRQK